MSVYRRDVSAMSEESLLNPPFGEKARFIWLVGVCAVLWVLWDVRNSGVSGGVERNPRELWSLVRFHVFL